MASPQLKNGYTKIANEILEAIVGLNYNGTDLSVVLHVIRKTYGFNKKTDRISITQFEKHINSSRPAICKSLNKLVVNKVLLVNKSLLVNEYGLNKDYTKWVVNKPLLVNKSRLTSKQIETQLVNKPLHTKDNTKDNIQKKEEKLKEFNLDDLSEKHKQAIKDKSESYYNNTGRHPGKNIKLAWSLKLKHGEKLY